MSRLRRQLRQTTSSKLIRKSAHREAKACPRMEAETKFPWMLALANAWRIGRSTAEDPNVLKRYSATFGETASYFQLKSPLTTGLLLSSRPDFRLCLPLPSITECMPDVVSNMQDTDTLQFSPQIRFHCFASRLKIHPSWSHHYQ